MRPARPLAGAATLAAGLLVLAGAVNGAMAARSAIIEIAIDFNDPGPASEVFTTNTELLCPEGRAYTDFHHFGGGGAGGSFHLTKLLVCEDGSGSFVITVDAGTNFVVGNGTNGGWSVVPGSGTGDYVGLEGGGSIVGVNQADGAIELIDYYYGRVGF